MNLSYHLCLRYEKHLMYHLLLSYLLYHLNLKIQKYGKILKFQQHLKYPLYQMNHLNQKMNLVHFDLLYLQNR